MFYCSLVLASLDMSGRWLRYLLVGVGIPGFFAVVLGGFVVGFAVEVGNSSPSWTREMNVVDGRIIVRVM